MLINAQQQEQSMEVGVVAVRTVAEVAKVAHGPITQLLEVTLIVIVVLIPKAVIPIHVLVVAVMVVVVLAAVQEEVVAAVRAALLIAVAQFFLFGAEVLCLLRVQLSAMDVFVR